ncbi:MAG TPA: PepSY-associated TM helix domain-containing protein [Rhodanobacteraceae bacterium]|nr:PepSY-associated TM helix domain-containing protein [Rhodanobacteraceae bacterium]
MPLPLKRVLFRLHWIAGLSAGLVLAVVGATGAILGFEDELTRLLNPQLRVVAEGGPQSPGTLVDAARAANPELHARSIAWNGDSAALIVRMARGRERGGVEVPVDPYSGAVLDRVRGKGFFETVEQLHRNLAAGPVGKEIVGASTALLLLLLVTGIVLRWPRRARSARAWLTFDTKLKGRPFLWHLHAVAATWTFVLYLVAALTGLWWSYDFYRNTVNGLAGVTTPMRRPPPSDEHAFLAPAALDAAWTAFRREVPDATRATIALGAADGPIEIRYQTPSSPHGRAWNTLKIDAASGQSLANELYAEQPRGRRFVSSLFPLHSGDFLGAPGRIAMAIAALLMPLFFVTGIWMWIARRTAAKARGRRAAESGAIADSAAARRVARAT